MGVGLAFGARRDSPWWRRGAIAAAVAALHLAAFLGLLMTHIVDVHLLTPRREPAMIYIALPLLPPVKPARAKSGAKGRDGKIPYFNPYSFGRSGPNAITIVQIKPYTGDSTIRCPLALRPGTHEWESRCVPAPPVVKYDNGVEEFSLVSHDSPAFKQWEAEMKKRNKPAEVPCTYTRKEKLPGGPYESSSAMVNVGCAARQLFGR